MTSIPITIHNLRMGFATNSSSTHSLILIPGGAEDSDCRGGEFGWQFFTAGSRSFKNLYTALQLRSAINSQSGPRIAQSVAEHLCGVRLSSPNKHDFFTGEYVDHSSDWGFPYDWDGKSVDFDFFDAVREFILRDDVVILGGNDNDDRDHELDNGSTFRLPFSRYEFSGRDSVVRKEDGYWTIFNRKTGAKIRMSFDTGKEVEVLSASAPELVDVKITDFCTKGCRYCYQDSGPEGKHADPRFLQALAYALGKLRVFEVAIGGGEPTSHPNFRQVLSAFRSQGVVPNFTTRNIEWLHNPRKRARILREIGAFAYSVERRSEVHDLASIRDAHELPHDKFAVQYVMGSTGLYEFREILEAAHDRGLPITLLSYKTDGRGRDCAPSPYDDWTNVLHELNKAKQVRVGIDTDLAAAFQVELDELEVPKWCYEVKDGVFSMYVDAVSMTTASSSYGSPDLRSLGVKPDAGAHHIRDEIQRHFASQNEVPK